MASAAASLAKRANVSWRWAWLLLLVVAAATGPRAVASQAHALLDSAEPPAGSKLTEAPAQLVLHFAQALKPESSWVLVDDAAGNEVAVNVGFDQNDRKLMTATFASPAGPGVYKVRWQTLSAADGDYAQGSYMLTILNPDGSNPAGTNASSGAESSGGGSGRVVLVLVVVAGVLVIAGGSLFVYRARTGGRA